MITPKEEQELKAVIANGMTIAHALKLDGNLVHSGCVMTLIHAVQFLATKIKDMVAANQPKPEGESNGESNSSGT